MRYDLVYDYGRVLFLNYPWTDAVAEQKWFRRAAGVFLNIVEHVRGGRKVKP